MRNGGVYFLSEQEGRLFIYERICRYRYRYIRIGAAHGEGPDHPDPCTSCRALPLALGAVRNAETGRTGCIKSPLKPKSATLSSVKVLFLKPTV